MDKDYAIQALIGFFKEAQLDGMTDDFSGDDEESIGWNGNEPMTMTYATIRHAAMAVDILDSAEKEPS